MSGQATGWVLRHGPHPDHVDRHGQKYGQRARGYRAVLLTIADAANRDGEHAHPGQQAMVEGSLYGRSRVTAIVRELIEEGWLGIEQEGGGRGRATVYCLPRMATETGQPVAPSAEANRAVANPKPRAGAAETARSAPETARSQPADQGERGANGLCNGNPPTTANGEGELTVNQRAKRLLDKVYERLRERGQPEPANYHQARTAVAKVLAAGWSDDDVGRACMAAPTITVGTLEFQLRQRQQRRGADRPGGPHGQMDTDRGGPSGRVRV